MFRYTIRYVVYNIRLSLPKKTSSGIFYFIFKVYRLGITMQLNIWASLIPQVTTIIYHHIKKNIIKKKYGRLD